MKRVAITMRVDISQPYGERRDSLDQRWHRFLGACGLTAIPIPNQIGSAPDRLDGAEGLILSGGNDLLRFGGDAPERDATEQALLQAAMARGMPVMGVCRGMQFLADHFGCALAHLPDHAGTRHVVRGQDGDRRTLVNSYHHYAVISVGNNIVSLGAAPDGSIEAFRHASLPLHGVMWHPEREESPQAEDIALFRTCFRTLS